MLFTTVFIRPGENLGHVNEVCKCFLLRYFYELNNQLGQFSVLNVRIGTVVTMCKCASGVDY